MTAMPAKDIQLWFIHEDAVTEDLLQQYRLLLNEDEAKRYCRFQFAEHSRRYSITRAAIRDVLCHYATEDYARVDPAGWQFITNEYGRPSVAASASGTIDPAFSFNISHSGKLIVIAATLAGEIGVDVEYTARQRRAADLAARYFSPVEADRLLALPRSSQQARFFDLWTLKEAYIKACGMGLAIPLRHFSFDLSRAGEINVAFEPERKDDPRRWCFWHLEYGTGYRIAIALKAGLPLSGISYNLAFRSLVPMRAAEAVQVEIQRASC